MRGAEVQNILNFAQDHPGCVTIKLEQNYRSTGTILDAANSVIRNNSVRTDKALWTADGKGRVIDLIVADSEEDEATKIVEQIMLEQYREKLRWADLAILYRSNAQSRAFEEKLRLERIPYVVIGGQQFYERKEVKDAIAYLKVADRIFETLFAARRPRLGRNSVAKIGNHSHTPAFLIERYQT